MDCTTIKVSGILNLFFLITTTAMNPGLKARISQHGIQYAADEATKVLTREVSSLTIPNQSGSSGHVKYEISNVRVTSFRPPTTTVTTAPFKWSLMGTSASLTGDWHYWYKKGFIKISDHGSFDIDISVDISTTITMGMDQTGRPTIHTAACNSAITHTSVKLHGGASWFYNIFDHQIADAIRRSLDGQLCSSVEQVINVKAQQSLATMPIELDLHNMVVLDYSLVAPPNFTASYIDALFKGEFFWKTDKQEYPSTPDPIPPMTSDIQMLSFWITKYSINSLAYAEYKHGTLSYQLSKDDLPAKSQSMLDTTCKSLFQPCIGGIVPEIGKMYPNTSVVIDMNVTESPTMDVAPSGITGNWTGITTFKAMLQNTTQRPLFSCFTKVKFNLTAGMSGLNITGRITSFDFSMALQKSEIGDVDVSGLNVVMKLVIDGFVVPKLNELGQEGMRLPAIKDVVYRNPKLQLIPNALFLAVDLEYIGQ